MGRRGLLGRLGGTSLLVLMATVDIILPEAEVTVWRIYLLPGQRQAMLARNSRGCWDTLALQDVGMFVGRVM